MICDDLVERKINNGTVFGCGRSNNKISVRCVNGRYDVSHSIPIRTQVDIVCKSSRCEQCPGYRM